MNLFRHIPHLLFLLTLGTAPASATLILDDFESYADTPALEAAWIADSGDPMLRLETNPASVHSGSQAMAVDYTVGDAPFEDILIFDLGPPQDWTSFNLLEIWYRAPSAPLNPLDDLFVEILDSGGGQVGQATISDGTRTTNWTPWTIDITLFPGNLADVMEVRLGVEAGSAFGSGTMFFDDISLMTVPEPSTTMLLSLSLLPLVVARGLTSRFGWRSKRSSRIQSTRT
ncbi:MAG: hypothetical protein AAF492_17000 [Verrucomicrobiota bacterium]